MGWLLISLPFVPVLFFLIWSGLESQHYFVRTTTLANEQIAGFSLNSSLSAKQLNYLNQFERMMNEDDGYLFESNDFRITMDGDDRVISLLVSDPSIVTSSGLKVGLTVEEAIAIYGEHYYTYREMCMGTAIVYVDRENRYELKIWMSDETVSYFSFSVY